MNRKPRHLHQNIHSKRPHVCVCVRTNKNNIQLLSTALFTFVSHSSAHQTRDYESTHLLRLLTARCVCVSVRASERACMSVRKHIHMYAFSVCMQHHSNERERTQRATSTHIERARGTEENTMNQLYFGFDRYHLGQCIPNETYERQRTFCMF